MSRVSVRSSCLRFTKTLTVGGQLTGNDPLAAGTALGRVEMNSAGDVAGLDDVTGYLGALYLAPHLAGTGARAI